MSICKLTAIASLLAACATGAATAREDASKLGKVDFPISCGANAQSAFIEGVTLLHHMMYHQSAERFSAAVAADDSCAMAYWGIAMSHFHPMWPGGQSEAEYAAGRDAAERAAAAEIGEGLEQAFVDAALAFYQDTDASYPQRLGAWAAAQQAVFERFPDDIDAGAFAALAKLSVASPADASFAAQREAGALLEKLHEKAPLHPGVFHYAIHAYDHPPLAPLAERFAEGYDKIAPSVPHALHMPSHIFVRLGRWEEGAAWNVRSAEAALAQPLADGVISNHYPHAIDYLVYSLLQMDEAEKARRHANELLESSSLEDNFGSAYALAASPARLSLERGDWAAAAALPDVPHASITWARFPQALAIVAFAQGLGAARSGDLDEATSALGRLSGFREVMSERDMRYWVTLADAQIGTVNAWMALARGENAKARELMEAAAETEDSVGKAPVTPGHVLPARELLGDLLVELGDHNAAAHAYEAALRISPNRKRSVEGLAAALNR